MDVLDGTLERTPHLLFCMEYFKGDQEHVGWTVAGHFTALGIDGVFPLAGTAGMESDQARESPCRYQHRRLPTRPSCCGSCQSQSTPFHVKDTLPFQHQLWRQSS